jgi:hypothetical protein
VERLLTHRMYRSQVFSHFLNFVKSDLRRTPLVFVNHVICPSYMIHLFNLVGLSHRVIFSKVSSHESCFMSNKS